MIASEPEPITSAFGVPGTTDWRELAAKDTDDKEKQEDARRVMTNKFPDN